MDDDKSKSSCLISSDALALVIFACSRKNNADTSPNVFLKVTIGSITSLSKNCPITKTDTPAMIVVISDEIGRAHV